MRFWYSAAALLACALVGCGGEDTASAPPVVATRPEAATAEIKVTPASTSTMQVTSGEATIGTRLRNSIAAGAPRIVSYQYALITHRSQSGYAAAQIFQPDDPKIRRLDGPYAFGNAYPFTKVLSGQAITAGTTDVLRPGGLPYNRRSLITGFEFVLPPGVNEFEFVHLNSGADQLFQLEIDGVPASAGFDSGRNSFAPGAFVYTTIKLNPATSARRIRLWTAAQPIGELRLPQGQSLGDLPERPNHFTVVFQGDSITEGSYAKDVVSAWPIQAAYRLGFDDPIIVAVGGSGYLARRATPYDAGYNFRERMRDVLEANNGGPPDMIVVAGGRNDCATANHPYTPEQVGAEALEYFKELRAAAPLVPIIVVGPFSDYAHPTYGTDLAACRDAIFHAAWQVRLVATIDVSTWANINNRSSVFVDTSTDPHPTTVGHAIYSYRFAEALKQVARYIP